MQEVGIFEAKAKLSELCSHVEEGTAEYIITRRGHPIARIVGMPRSETASSLGLLERMKEADRDLGSLADEADDADDFPDVWLERSGSVRTDPIAAEDDA